MISALFVETNGCYFGLPDVDPWDINRDARLYPGPFPVVAHPPCERWGRYAKGTPGNQVETPGADAGCFATALHSLRLWGGVLEHPKDSMAWPFFGLTRPWPSGWTHCHRDEWVCQVDQGNYGHPAPKPTWLLYRGPRPPELVWGPSSAEGRIENMSRNQRLRTPEPFRDLLIALAELSQGIKRGAA